MLRAYADRFPEVPVERVTFPHEGLVDSDVVDRFMVENLRATHIPGAIVAITRNGGILHVAGYGHTADGAAVTSATPMPVASLTKSFTSAAVMRLVEQQKVRLDAPVQDYLPEFELADPRGALITVAHLLGQTSGLSNRGLPPRPRTPPRSLTEQLEWLRGATLSSEPGTQFTYCNENYDVLALLIERIRGLPFAQSLEDIVFAPLDMRSSRVFLSLAEPMPGIAEGHTLMFGVPVARRMPNDFGSGGGGAVSSAEDLARWLVFQSTGGATVDGERLLSESSVAAMHVPSLPGSNYGFGWNRAALADGTEYLHHSGRLPHFAAHERLFPRTGYAYAVVLNGMHPFNAEAASFIAGLSEIVSGESPTIGPPFLVLGQPWGLIADAVLALMIVLFTSIGVFGALRSHTWVAQRRGVATWRLALRFIPYVAMSLGLAVLPWLMSVANRGQRVPLGVIFAQWPPLGIVFATMVAAGVVVIVFRGARLFSARYESAI